MCIISLEIIKEADRKWTTHPSVRLHRKAFCKNKRLDSCPKTEYSRKIKNVNLKNITIKNE